MGGDRELTIWLMEKVLGARRSTESYWRLPQGLFIDGNHIIGPNFFTPLESLDDARALEDRLRELGMEEAYAKELSDMHPCDKYTGYHESLVDIIYADARTRCEAVRRTWLARKEREGTK